MAAILTCNLEKAGMCFSVDFTRDGYVDSIALGGIDVTDVLSDRVVAQIQQDVRENAAEWFDSAMRESAKGR